MSSCTFFGHKDCPESIKEKLYSAIEELIGQGVDMFYVGSQGRFDAMARDCLRRIGTVYPHIRYAVVLAYLPTGNTSEDLSDTMYPEGMEAGPRRYAIDRRNRWMIGVSEYAVCYVRHGWGGAAKYAALAIRRGKHVVDL